MQNVTLAYVVDRVVEKYGRSKASTKARLVGDLNEWINRACRRFNFWFLQRDPGLSVVSQFPLTAFSDLTAQKGGWVDTGWLRTTASTPGYLYAYPTIQGFDSSDNSNPDMIPTRWAWGEISSILAVREYDIKGAFLRSLPVMAYDEFATFMTWERTARPERVTFQSHNGVSTVHFAPTPDTAYLYQVVVRNATLTPLDRPDSTNEFLVYYPDVILAAGMLITAQYFHEAQEIAYWEKVLYGAEYGQLQDGGKVSPGGLIGDVIADTRRRHSNPNQEMAVYTSSGRALGRDNTLRRTRGPYGYYWARS